MANQFLSLSLFLMLLSFFIVLNSMSVFEEKKAVPAVLNSLNLAFTGRARTILQSYGNLGPSAIPTQGRGAQGEGDTLETLEGLFNAHLAGFQAKKNRLGTVMHVNLPIDSFERVVKISSITAPQGGDATPLNFSQTMVTLLRSAQAGNPYRLDIVYNLENDPIILMRGAPDAFKKALVRVSALTEILESKGLPKKMVSAGLMKGKAGYVDLYFYRYKPLAVPDEIKKMQAQEEEEKKQAEETQETEEQDAAQSQEQTQEEQAPPGEKE
ncbi:MAG: hypothetical protein ACLFP8_01400 [Alphaproteobacteria bacterium]